MAFVRRVIGAITILLVLATTAAVPAQAQTGTAQTEVTAEEFFAMVGRLLAGVQPVDDAMPTGLATADWSPDPSLAQLFGVGVLPVLVSPAAIASFLATAPDGVTVHEAGDPAYGSASVWSNLVGFEVSRSFSEGCRAGVANEAAAFYAQPGVDAVVDDPNRPGDPGVGMTNVISLVCLDAILSVFFGQSVGGIMAEFAAPLSVFEVTALGRVFVVFVLIDPSATVRPVVSSASDIADALTYGFEQAADLAADTAAALSPAAILAGLEGLAQSFVDGIGALGPSAPADDPDAAPPPDDDPVEDSGADPPADPVESGSETGIGGDGGDGGDGDDDGSALVLLLLIALVLGLLALAFVLWRRINRRETPPCECSIVVTIEGDADMGVCCTKPTLLLNPVLARGEGHRIDPSRIHVDANLPGAVPRDLFDRVYQATVTANCSGGGTVDLDRVTYDWRVVERPDGFDLSVDVTAPVVCPGGKEHPPATGSATLVAGYHDAPCIVRVLVEQTEWNEISHVDVHIICGEYSEIFGYFPTSRTLAEAMFGVKGEVIRYQGEQVDRTKEGWLSRDISDEIGPNYSFSHGSKTLNVYEIELADCTKCEELRRLWMDLYHNPRDYYLTGFNCATNAYDLLLESGVLGEEHSHSGVLRPGQVEVVLQGAGIEPFEVEAK